MDKVSAEVNAILLKNNERVEKEISHLPHEWPRAIPKKLRKRRRVFPGRVGYCRGFEGLL